MGVGGLIRRRGEGCRWEYFGGLAKIGGGDVMSESLLRIASTRGGGLNSRTQQRITHCNAHTAGLRGSSGWQWSRGVSFAQG